MTHLFLFTLGPVQSFIAQARKAHDLYSGSTLLSYLCRVAAQYFESQGGKVIFPDINSPSIPNRFLGKITMQNNLQTIGENVAEAVQIEWKKRFDELLAEQLDEQVYQVANRQIEQHLDIQWLFETLVDDTDETYRKAYENLNKNLNAIKNTRPFYTPEETGRKCSLDGERNVIFYRKTLEQKINRTNEQVQIGNPLYSTDNLVLDYKPDSFFKLRHLQPGEGLSAVSMLKRSQGFDAPDFPSTAEFALAETMQLVGQKSLDEMTKHFEHSHPDFLNWQIFYEENLNERYFEKQGLPPHKLEEAKNIQERLKKAARDNGRNLEKYYALVVFDGDHMGEWWKGDRIKDSEGLEQFHIDLTNCLADFSKAVRDKYAKDDYRGWVVYAGGDDFLGFFNLHHLTDGLNFLHETYHKLVHEPLAARIKDGNVLTFSAGVCIAHYKEPLSLVLSQARDMEKAAKLLQDKKDAIGVGTIPGSGQIAEVVLPFEEFPTLCFIISNLQSPDFSNAFVSKARAELAVFVDKDGKLEPCLLPTAESLLDRAVSRACNLEKKEDEEDEAFKARKREKIEPLQNAVKAMLKANGHKLNAFLDALDIADFIERQTHVSTSKPKTIDA
ncbi:MAG: type III-B CRISPR-associated protein Cas10/Cmr2 [Saprospiraceae bacterium]|nr:type III-B CRISPR-associated protein Cas10/Cmr2 [Saprospiraceae bacterium]MCF8249251.1 type III-B CRISPR-associated protein Cas10/Cmr2 [Saprospiraceae bacterium]MCF8281181.1 type III-B CRISPR-associated protein Cas10/Cmr2 [Bacteroidales bacterium]MCF8311472.1 type III-B CRISPR-associated protein Cas10/Cmr2 [Saprospiraceae bacterium]MCF8439870.1 type III-B CRISPR-associated protein Cas10/Cmr2 [Saprospiraceae bacterium]